MVDDDLWPNVDRCECGVLLVDHPPLPDPKPWGGWRSEGLDASKQRETPFQSFLRRPGPGVFARRMTVNPKKSPRWASMTEEERAADRAASRRYYERNREQILERRRAAHAARKSA